MKIDDEEITKQDYDARVARIAKDIWTEARAREFSDERRATCVHDVLDTDYYLLSAPMQGTTMSKQPSRPRRRRKRALPPPEEPAARAEVIDDDDPMEDYAQMLTLGTQLVIVGMRVYRRSKQRRLLTATDTSTTDTDTNT